MEETTTRRGFPRIRDGFVSLWTGHRIAVIVTAVCMVLLSLVLLWDRALCQSLKHQTFADRWSDGGDFTQVSVFYSQSNGPDTMTRLTFEHSLDQSYTDDGIETAAGARLTVTATSFVDKLNFTGQHNVALNTVVCGGDYFYFHPERLIYGSVFSGSDLMQDCVVLDEDAAWQLFGAVNVEGMTVTLKGQELRVSGVVKRECTLLEKLAGKDVATVYLSYVAYESLYGQRNPDTYEILLPNPVPGYGMGLVEKALGEASEDMRLVENTTRFNLISRIKDLFSFPTRSMATDRVIPPSWENAARGMEDLLVLILLLELILLIPIVIALVRILIALGKAIGNWFNEERKRNDWHSEEYGKARH